MRSLPLRTDEMLPSDPVTERTIRVGFVGAGKNTRSRHSPGFQNLPGVELVAVANRSRESGERVAREFGIARVYAHWRDLVRAGDVDAVCIGTWPYMHCEITLAALEHGKHVLCEARMAMNAAEGRSMLYAARRARHLVAQLVPAPHTLEVDATLQALVAEGYVGEVLAVELQATQGRFVDPDEPRRLEADARRLWGGRRGDRELREIAIPAEQRIGWRVEEEFVNAIRGREKVLRTTFEDGARYMEFTEAVARSAALGQAIDVADL